MAITNLKYNDQNNFYQFSLLLSWDVSLNPVPVQISSAVNTNVWKPLNRIYLHFLHININSLLKKIDKLKCIINKIKAAIIWITEKKLDHTVPNLEVNVPGLDILWCDRNTNRGGVACYVRNDLNFNKRALHCREVEHIIFDILLPKLKQLTMGVSYRPPNQTKFMELVVKNFYHLNLTDNEIYLLGDISKWNGLNLLA